MASGRDRFSELSADILDQIMGLLPTEVAARMAVLSTYWRDSWLSLSRLCFDESFFHHNLRKDGWYYAVRDKKVIYDNKNINDASLYVISKVLKQHKGYIRKFDVIFPFEGDGTLGTRILEVDQWFSFVAQKGVEEIHLRFEKGFLLPSRIFSCPTLRRLHLSKASYDTVNSPRMFPNLIELCFEDVEFQPNGLLDRTINAPMLVDLSFHACDETMFYFNINAPKLSFLTIQCCFYGQKIGNPPVKLSFLGNVRYLYLDSFSLKYFLGPFIMRKLLQPCELDVECLLIEDPICCDCTSDYHSAYRDISSTFIRLLQLCPKLREIHMEAMCLEEMFDCLKPGSRLSGELYRVAQTLHSLHTLILNFGPFGDAFLFCWKDSHLSSSCDDFDLSYNDFLNHVKGYAVSYEELLLCVQGLLSSFPTLERFIIGSQDISYRTAQKILSFPRASPKAQVLFTC